MKIDQTLNFLSRYIMRWSHRSQRRGLVYSGGVESRRQLVEEQESRCRWAAGGVLPGAYGRRRSLDALQVAADCGTLLHTKLHFYPSTSILREVPHHGQNWYLAVPNSTSRWIRQDLTIRILVSSGTSTNSALDRKTLYIMCGHKGC